MEVSRNEEFFHADAREAALDGWSGVTCAVPVSSLIDGEHVCVGVARKCHQRAQSVPVSCLEPVFV